MAQDSNRVQLQQGPHLEVLLRVAEQGLDGDALAPPRGLQRVRGAWVRACAVPRAPGKMHMTSLTGSGPKRENESSPHLLESLQQFVMCKGSVPIKGVDALLLTSYTLPKPPTPMSRPRWGATSLS